MVKNKRRRGSRRKVYRRGKRERQIQLIRKVLAMVLALFVVLLIVLIIQDIRVKSGAKEVSQQQAADQGSGDQEEKTAAEGADSGEGALSSQEVAPVQLTISAAGDCTLGSDEGFDEESSFDTMYDSVGEPSYFFRNVKSIFENDDLTIVNMEGPLTTSEDLQEKEFSFKGRPEYTRILTEGSVEAVNLANNHSYDYGEQGYQDTIQNVENAGITSFGYERTALLDIKGVKVGLAGIYVLKDGMERESQLKEHIASLKQQGAQLVIVNFHWGSEKENYPDDIQVSLAHTAVDNGADLVVGHHPHVLQGIEKYNGKYIVYSLANFCFGGNSNPSDKDTMIFQQTFTIQNQEVAKDDNIQIIPCSVSSESNYNNYQPTPAEGEEKTRIQEKIDQFSSSLLSREGTIN